MIPTRDYGQPPPGGQVYTPEQTADMLAAANARKMAAALTRYAADREFAARWGVEHSEAASRARAEGRVSMHPYPWLLAMLEGEA